MTAKSNGFEGGSDETAITAGNSGGASGDAFDSDILNATFDSARAAHGSLSCRLSVAGASSAYVSWATVGTTWYTRTYLQLTAAPPLNMQVIKPMSGATIRAMIRVMTDRTVQITDSAFANLGQSTTVLATGQWYRIETKFVQGTTTAGLITCRIYATPDGGTPAETLTSTSATVSAWDRIRFAGDFSSTTTNDVWHDDVAISDVDWIGAVPAAAATSAPPLRRPQLRNLLVR